MNKEEAVIEAVVDLVNFVQDFPEVEEMFRVFGLNKVESLLPGAGFYQNSIDGKWIKV